MNGITQTPFSMVPQAPAMVPGYYVDPMQQISTILALAQQFGYPIKMEQFHSRAPSLEDLSRIFRGDVDHLAPLREAAQRMRSAEATFLSTRKPWFLPNRRKEYVSVRGAYEAAMNDCYAIGAALGLDSGDMGAVASRGGLGGYLLAHIAKTEYRDKLAAVSAFRELAEDAARYTMGVLAMIGRIHDSMQPGGRLHQPVYDIARDGSRYAPTERAIEQAEHEVLPTYLPPAARAVEEGRPLVIYPPQVRNPRPIVAEPMVSDYRERVERPQHVSRRSTSSVDGIVEKALDMYFGKRPQHLPHSALRGRILHSDYERLRRIFNIR